MSQGVVEMLAGKRRPLVVVKAGTSKPRQAKLGGGTLRDLAWPPPISQKPYFSQRTREMGTQAI
jgi:hypothetical protein